MTAYDDMDSAELRAELDDWTARTIRFADDMANAIESLNLIRAAGICMGYRQARMQMRKLKKCLEIGIA